jgi:hypothetical protein
MRGSIAVDPARCNFGPGTAAVREVLREWTAIDWFVPPSPMAAWDATREFEQHHRLARALEPQTFPDGLEVETRRGGWPEFCALYERVRTQSWDWKFGALKQLSRAHSQLHGWSLDDAVPPGQEFDPGDLIIRFGEVVAWNHVTPALGLRDWLDPSAADAAGWYLGYAQADVLECIEWQLAARSDRLDDNPFLPLLRCYAAGFYPFSLAPSEVVLFGLS